MKIGILTQPLTTNYGGILQNFAMQQVLKQLGYDSVTIRIPHGWQNMSFGDFLLLYPKYLIAHFIQIIKDHKNSRLPESIWKWRKRVAGMEAFIQKNISTTAFIDGSKINLCDIEQNNINCLLVGSDQVWHAGLPYMCNAYFCRFAKGSGLKRIAYSASFGFDRWRGSESQRIEAKELIKEFKAVGVRENVGVVICQQSLGRDDAKWVLDPTLLVDKSVYLDLCEGVKPLRESFLYAYILDYTEEKKMIVESIAKSLDCAIRLAGVKSVTSEDSVENWLASFRDAKFVITDSYHGTVFSLIFQKEFICINNTSRGKSRMDSLRMITGLENRFVDTFKGLPNDAIDYNKINNRIKTKRETSLTFLQNALNG